MFKKKNVYVNGEKLTNPVIVGMVMLVIGVTVVMLEDNNSKAGELVNPDRLEKATSSPTIGEWHGVVEVSAYNAMESQTDSTPTNKVRS
jgi:hypothetical protein